MWIPTNKYDFELCKRRRVKFKPHPIITNPTLLKAMIIEKNIVAQRVQQYEKLLQEYQDFFRTVPLMRCLDDHEHISETQENEIILERMHEEFLRKPRGRRSHSRGELQIRAFWDNVRLQLQTDEDDEEEDEDDGNNDIEERETKFKIPSGYYTRMEKEVKDHVNMEAQPRKLRRLISVSRASRMYECSENKFDRCQEMVGDQLKVLGSPIRLASRSQPQKF